MILSGRDLQWYVDTGRLGISKVAPDQFQQNGVDLILECVEGNPSEFAAVSFHLGVLRERISMPDDLMAFVELRSTWARKGLLIPPTIIDAGFIGDITLEIVSFSELTVPYGQRFAHIVFAKMTSPSRPYRGKYHEQRGITHAISDERGRDINWAR